MIFDCSLLAKGDGQSVACHEVTAPPVQQPGH